MKNADSLGSDNHGDNCIKTSGCIHIHPAALGDFQEHTESATRGLFRILLSCSYPVICKLLSLIYRNVVCESHNIFSLSPTSIIVENPELIQWYSFSWNCLICTLLNLSAHLLKWSMQVRRLKYCLRQPVPLCSYQLLSSVLQVLYQSDVSCSSEGVLRESKEKPSPLGNASLVTKVWKWLSFNCQFLCNFPAK